MIRRFAALLLLFGLLACLFFDKSCTLKEHLTAGGLPSPDDTSQIDKRLTTLEAEFAKLSAKAKEGADASAAARAQMDVLKTS